MSRLTLRSLRPFHRTLASVAPGPPPSQASTPFEVFDRSAKRRQRDRAATRDGGEKSRVTDYLRGEVADRMAERFEVRPFRSPACFVYGTDAAMIGFEEPTGKDPRPLLEFRTPIKAPHRTRIDKRNQDDGYERYASVSLFPVACSRLTRGAEKSLWRDDDSAFDRTSSPSLPPLAQTLISLGSASSLPRTVIPRRTVIDEEQLLSAVDEGSQDCIVSNMGLHWVNDLPGTLFATPLPPASPMLTDYARRRRPETDPTCVETRRSLYGLHDRRRHPFRASVRTFPSRFSVPKWADK